MSNYIPVFIRGVITYPSVCFGQLSSLSARLTIWCTVHRSLRRGNSNGAPDSTERPGLHEDEEKLSNVLEEDTRIEQIHAAMEPHFKSDSTSQSPALSEDQDNSTKRTDSLRKRRSVGHRDINKLSNILSKQQEALDALLNTYVRSSP